MGLLIPIEADPPFETVDELAALVRTGDDHEVKVELSTADPELVRRLVAHGQGTADVKFTTAPSAAPAIAAYARTRAAGYLDARHGGGTLRVWRDDVWLDGLAADPGFGEVEPRVVNGANVWGVRDAELEAALALWVELAAGERLTTFASGAPSEELDRYLAAARELIDVRVLVDVSVAAAIATEHPALETTWSCCDLHIDLPVRTARIWRLHPISTDQEAEARARFARSRARAARQ